MSSAGRPRRWGVLAAVALTAPALLVPALLVPSPTSARPATTAVFFVPHQDDDVLMYGADLKNHVLAGRRTIAVLLTDGSSSSLCRRRYGENRAACAAARDLEFQTAMRTLGVTPVVWPARPTDGRLTKRDVQGVMRSYLARFPDAALRAPTPRDINAALSAYQGFGQLSQPAAFDEQYGGARASLDPSNYNQGGADSKFHR